MKLQSESMKHVARAIAALAVLATPAVGVGKTITARATLAPTTVDTDARGQAGLTVHGSKSKLDLKARRLARNASYEVIANGVKVGALQTSKSGNGRLRFRAAPKSKDLLLGFDPRGAQLSVRGADGRDVLVGTMDAVDPSSSACCLTATDGTSSCQELAADACTTAGGVPNAAATCLPDPCAAPPSPAAVVCCVNETDDDGTESECEDLDATACAAAGGTTLEADTCEPNPCAAVTPPAGDVAACCLTHENETECEVRTAEACTTRGGTVMTGVAACDGDPCGTGSGSDDGGDDGEHGDGQHGGGGGDGGGD